MARREVYSPQFAPLGSGNARRFTNGIDHRRIILRALGLLQVVIGFDQEAATSPYLL